MNSSFARPLMERVCILIPAYNAEQTLGQLLERIRSLEMDSIVVNDGSKDDTRMVAEAHKASVLEHPFNQGKGAALRTGFQYVLQKGYHVVITIDADGQHNPLEIPTLLKIFERVKPDILIASRSGAFGEMTFLRRFWNRLGSRAVSRLCHSDITDSQSGFRLIRKEVLTSINLSTTGYETEMELLIKSCKKGFSVLSVPIKIHEIDGTGSSHFKPVVDTWLICKLFLRSLFW